MTEKYELMKLEYTQDPFNIPEKLYTYYDKNGYSRKEVIRMNDTIEESIYQGGVAERNIPEGKDETSYKELMDLLGGFGFDHNYSITMKRKLLREIGSVVLARIPYPPSKPLDNSFFNMYNQYYQTTGNSTTGEEFADPNWNANHTKEGGRRIRRKTRRNRRIRRKSYRRRR